MYKKFFIDQHGCAKNQVDGELIVSQMIKLGIMQTFVPEEADIIIVNSCGFIESAKKESIDSVCSIKEEYPHAKVLLAGCLAERYAKVFEESLPEADGIFGNGDLSKLGEIISSLQKDERPVKVFPQDKVCCGERKSFLSFRGSAYVKITEGCSNHCSFCAIPLIRGELRSRPIDEIISEIEELLKNGIVEINLIGQDLAAYGTGENDAVLQNKDENTGTSFLSLLLKKISEIPGDFIVRPLYMHPDHFNRDILEVMKKDERLVPYFDIPFQSGDDRIIKLMNRKGTASEYIKLVLDIRSALPNAVIRTTFLTGFPSETEKEALNTVEFLKSINCDWSGCFAYSLEEDTPAYDIRPLVSNKKAEARAKRLSEIQAEVTRKSLSKYVGQEHEILIEEIVSDEGDEGLAIGRAWFQAPEVDGAVVVRFDAEDEYQKKSIQPGRFIKAKVIASSDVDLDAIFVSDSIKNHDLKSDYTFAPELA